MKTEKLASILAKLPEVQRMVEAEETSKRNAAIKARLQARTKVDELEKASAQAQQKLEAASKKLADARAALKPLEVEALKASEFAADVNAKYAVAYKEWVENHGEGHVLHAMYMMQVHRHNLEATKSGYESNLWREKGMPWARKRPEVLEAIAEVEGRIEKLDQAYSELVALQGIEATPEELRSKVELLTDRIGLTGEAKNKHFTLVKVGA